MSLISDGIDKVRVFELPAGIRADGVVVGTPRIALVKWRTSWTDKLYQIYVNGRYAGSTVESAQRQMVVHLPTSFDTAVRIEVFAVETEDAAVDFSSELDWSAGETGRVKITLLRNQKLPLGAAAQIYSDNGTGQIDYDTPINELPIYIWPSWQDKTGFGMSCFGEVDFGYDSAAAVGFGIGYFGYGWYGQDADTIEWVSKAFGPGVYKFAAKIFDQLGNISEAVETGEVTVIPAATPAESLSVSSFDKQANQLVLSIA